MTQPAVPLPMLGQGGSLDGLTLALQTIMSGQAAIGSDVAAMRAEVARLGTRLEVIEVQNRTADEFRHDIEARVRVIEARESPADLDGRLRSLENFRYLILGVAAVGGTVAGWVGQWLAQHVHP
jgi:hypothetical protein